MNSISKMDDSEDGRKRKNNLLSEWTANPFERVNHSTNFEDYACSSDDTNFLYCSPEDKSHEMTSLSETQTTIRDSVPKAFPKLNTKPIVSSLPLITHSSEPRDQSFVESCISAGNSSADVTPAGTPQSSPYTIRKPMDNKMANNGNKKLTSNPKRWFYTGFFNPEVKTGIDTKTIGQLPKNPSLKNLCVSNFDINAVGPTSW